MDDASSLGLISADSHVNEPRELWSENLPSALRAQAMHGIESAQDGGWQLILDGRHIGRNDESEAERLSVLVPENRLAVMRDQGIVGECIYPTVGLYVWALQDPEGGKVSCRIYNDWILDQLECRSPRFRCAGLIPTWNVADAIAEVELVAERGLGAHMLPAVATPEWNHRDWVPLWDAIEQTTLPVVMHQGTGHDMIWYRGRGATLGNVIYTQSMGPRTAALLSSSGILHDHPGLHVVFVEYNIAWLAWTMQTIDSFNDSYLRVGTTDKIISSRTVDIDGATPKPIINPQLPASPSTYLRDQIHATFQDDEVGMANVAFTGPRALMWGSDYPHEEGTYPNTRATVDRLGKLVDDASAALVFRDTARELFHFPAEVLTTPV